MCILVQDCVLRFLIASFSTINFMWEINIYCLLCISITLWRISFLYNDKMTHCKILRERILKWWKKKHGSFVLNGTFLIVEAFFLSFSSFSFRFQILSTFNSLYFMGEIEKTLLSTFKSLYFMGEIEKTPHSSLYISWEKLRKILIFTNSCPLWCITPKYNPTLLNGF